MAGRQRAPRTGSAFVLATVAATPPLALAFLGDPSGVSVPAINGSGQTLAVGDLVNTQVRRDRAQLPIVQGKVS